MSIHHQDEEDGEDVLVQDLGDASLRAVLIRPAEHSPYWREADALRRALRAAEGAGKRHFIVDLRGLVGGSNDDYHAVFSPLIELRKRHSTEADFTCRVTGLDERRCGWMMRNGLDSIFPAHESLEEAVAAVVRASKATNSREH